MKKLLLLCMAFIVTANVSAQEESGLYKSENLYYVLDDANKTATLSSWKRLHNGAYDNYNCYSGNIVVPEKLANGYTVTGIGDECFNVCTELTSVTLPGTLKTIGEYAFSYCSKLTSISIPGSVESIDNYCFHECRAIETLNIEDSDNPLSIGISTFNLGTVFYELFGLKTVYVGRNIESERPAFNSCRSIKSIKFGNKVTALQKSMCNGADALEEADISTSITEIPEKAFYYCYALCRLALGNNTSVIGDDAFTCCNLPGINLKKVKLTSIGRYAFSYNVNATFLELPETLTYVSDLAFNNCRSLTEITCDAVTPPSCGGGEVFGSVDWKNCKLIVPEGSVDAYKSAFVWKNFFNIESGINETKNESTVVKDSYSVSGQRTTGNYRGLTIQRTNDGQTRKVIVR